MTTGTRVERASVATLALLIAAAVAVPLLASRDPLRIDDVLARRLIPPFAFDARGAWRLLGTDRFGRDLFVRMMLAGRLSLLVGVAGIRVLRDRRHSARRTGWVARRLARSHHHRRGGRAARAAAARVAACRCRARQPGLATILVVLVATGWMGTARLVRAEVLSVRERPYVPAAIALGGTSVRVLFRHVIPNALGRCSCPPRLVVGNAILLESGLSFLGLGIQPPAPSWGNMIAGGQTCWLCTVGVTGARHRARDHRACHNVARRRAP